MKKLAGIVALAAALALTTACQDETTPRPGGTPTTAAPAAPGSAQPSDTQQPPGTTQAAGGGAPATAGNGKCVDLKSPVVTAALGKIGPSVSDAKFVAYSGTEAAVGSCPALLWVLADTEGGTASSPWHVLLFNHAGFLGTATKKWTSYTSVVGSTDRSVRVEYRWLAHSDASCCPTGGPVDVTLTLGADGHTVTPDRDFPSEVTNPK
ncbi:LppP/LprE family lipoprotein [Nocardia tengchongensis]|uniref:LppP/LprE family lipoprotein n=1 Tax=Nocardia tengchongensis TaxID=2055889 RepID=A0ABX8CRU6_9NOCA|nr:LppP/LprE family lipoprotein [Nocardia tengchongensis]QVI22036.1 LppP/LprE family lipoprotein [Nocardia tengchongensis]